MTTVTTKQQTFRNVWPVVYKSEPATRIFQSVIPVAAQPDNVGVHRGDRPVFSRKIRTNSRMSNWGYIKANQRGRGLFI